MATLHRIPTLLAAGWLALAAAPALACTPKTFPDSGFPAQTEAERPLAEAFFAASDAQDLAAQETAAQAWLAYQDRAGRPGHWFPAFILERLGLAQGQQGKNVEATASFRRAYDLYRKAFGEDSPEARSTGEMLAISQFKLGRMAEARATIMAVSKAADAAACPDSDAALASLRLWGQVVDNGGAASEAASVWGELAARRLRRFGEADPDLAMAEISQGIKLLEAERPIEALPVLARAAQRFETITGPRSDKALEARAWEAQALFGAGRFKDAEARSQAVMDTARQALGPKAAATLQAEETYLRVLIAQGAFDRAPEVFTSLLQGRTRTFGENAAETLDIAEVGASLYEKLDQFAAAETLRRTLLEASIRKHGANSDHALVRLNYLADLLSRADRAGEAEALLLPVWRRIGPGAARETELDTGLQLAVIYLYQERNADAEPLLRDLSMRSTRALGPRAFLTLDINKNLAICIGRRGRMAEAEALHRETWAGWKAVRGESHPTTILSGLQVARSITDPKRIPERITLISELDTTLTKAGQTSSANATQMAIMSTMGNELMRYGLYPQAEAIWTQIRSGYVTLFGIDNPRTRDATETLARALGEQRKDAKAELMFAELVASEERVAGPGGPRSSDWIVAQAGLGLSRTLQGRARDGYPALVKAVDAVYARSADRRMIGSGAEERRKVLQDNRYIFNGLLRAGWAFAHEP